MTPNRPNRVHAVAALVLLLLLAGCSEERPDFNLTNATGKIPDLKLGMPDTHGEMRSADELRGRVVLMYFGYTHCPDACPMSLGRIKRALAELPADKAERTTVVFVTVDPDRDTPDRVRSYLADFRLPHAIGLVGDGEAFERLKERYHIHVELQREGPDDTDYEVTHPSQVYVFGPDGRARLLARLSGAEPDAAEDLAADLETLL